MKLFLRSFKHALTGILENFKLGLNTKIQWLATIIVITSGFLFHFTMTEWIAVTICIAMVLSMEAINTAIELLADEITLEKRESIRKIKDLSAGGVLLASICAVIVAGIIVWSHLKSL